MNSPMLSKINWTQIVAFAAMIAAMFGMDLTPETQAAVVSAVVAIQGVLTIIFRTWFTAKV